MNQKYRESDIKVANKAIEGIGISMFEEDGTYRPFNEVMKDIGDKFHVMRSNAKTEDDIKQFNIIKDFVIQSIVGIRYKNEFLN